LIQSQIEKEFEFQKKSQNTSVGRPADQPAHVHGRPADRSDPNREQPVFSRSTMRSTAPCHGRPDGRPGYSCACRAYRLTGRSIGLLHRSTVQST